MAATVPRPADDYSDPPRLRTVYTNDPKHPGERRLARASWLPNRTRHMIIAIMGEFVGTFLFLFFAFAGTQVANTIASDPADGPNLAALLYISLAFGFSLAVTVWIFFRISGGLFNPAVSIGLALAGGIGWLKALLLIISQILGGIAAAAVVAATFPGPMPVRTTLNPYTSVVRGLFIEMFLTALLMLTILMLAAEKHRATFLAPVGIGLALFIAELAGVWFTGGSLNPARSFGPDVVLRNFDHYHWIYWIGPILGAILAVIFYRLIKFLEYETANPGVDSDGRPVVPVRYVESPVPEVVDTRGASRRTDGTDESDFAPPFHGLNKPHVQHQEHVSGKEGAPTVNISNGNSTSSTSTSAQPPQRPSPIHPHGTDGHRSSEWIDHPIDRPRAHHAHNSSRSSRSRSHYSEFHNSDSRYRSGPTLESASSDSTSGTATSGSGSGSGSSSIREHEH